MPETYTIKALSPIGKVIAARMVEAKRTIPHFRLSVEVEVDALLALRTELQRQNSEIRLTLNDLLIKATAAGLTDTPAVNIQWAETEIYQCQTADISVVMALEEGLSTPIVRDAARKSVWEISREVKELATRAARHALRMNEIVGGSFSISNLGMFGIDRFDAIINPPQCAILAIGAAKPRIVVTPERETRLATIMSITLSCDHRAIDGATGAKFLCALRERIEQPEHLLRTGQSMALSR